MVPGSMETTVLPVLERASGAPPGALYEVCCNPEFMREGSAVDDFFHPGRVVIGGSPLAVETVAQFYAGIEARVFKTTLRMAEAIKFADNSFHALKVAFANELGRYAYGVGIDPLELAELFVADERLNLSGAYLRPGGPFGGRACPRTSARCAPPCRRSGNALRSVLDGAVASNGLHHRISGRPDRRSHAARRQCADAGAGVQGGHRRPEGKPAHRHRPAADRTWHRCRDLRTGLCPKALLPPKLPDGLSERLVFSTAGVTDRTLMSLEQRSAVDRPLEPGWRRRGSFSTI